MNMLLQDKVVIISGVGPGMGQVLAKIAAAEGARVGLGARNQIFLDEVVAEIKAAGGEAVGLSTDVTDAGQCQALAAATEQAFGRIDGLVNSAFVHGDWETTDIANVENYGAVFNVNCAGALRMAQACLPAMRRVGGGAIVNVSTMSTVNPYPGEGAYCAGKGGLNALTRHMAKDFGPHNIRVNLTRPGWIDGVTVRDYIDGQVAAGHDRTALVAEITARIPIGVIPPEADCAKAILFLVSDYSKMVVGATLDINGGQYMAP